MKHLTRDPGFLYRCRAKAADTPEEAEKWLTKAELIEAAAANPSAQTVVVRGKEYPIAPPGILTADAGPRHDLEVSRPALSVLPDTLFANDNVDAPLDLGKIKPERPISLTAARAHKTGSAREWTVRDALEHALADLDKPDSAIARSTRCVLIFGQVDEGGETDTVMVVATANRFERDGLIAGALTE